MKKIKKILTNGQKRGAKMTDKDKKKYPKDIDKKSWDKMTDFTLNMLALATTLGALAIIISGSLLFYGWLR